MKLIIDISDQIYDWIEHTGVVHHEDCGYLGGAILDGITIPGNATNGDVIQALFPNIEKDNERLIQKFGSQALYDTFEKWCSLPYKAGDTDE